MTYVSSYLSDPSVICLMFVSASGSELGGRFMGGMPYVMPLLKRSGFPDLGSFRSRVLRNLALMTKAES
jgi:hypothetical protein